jgi:hypothetical protein
MNKRERFSKFLRETFSLALSRKWRAARFFLLTAVLVFFAGCGPKDERRQIAETVRRMADLAEERDLDGLMDRFSPDYSDFEGRDKAKARELIRGYFEGRVGIVIHLLGTEALVDSPESARVRAEAALSSGAAEVFRKLFRSFGELYLFDLEMKKSGEEWRLVFARWRAIGPEELSPGAAKILRKLFPD